MEVKKMRKATITTLIALSIILGIAASGQSISFAATQSSYRVWTSKRTFAPGERIEVRFANLPGSYDDWVTVVGAGASYNSYGQWFRTNGYGSGYFFFDGLRPGYYEARVHYVYYGRWYADRFSFTVSDSYGGGYGGQLSDCGNYQLGNAIYNRWIYLGGSRSILGCPVMNEARATRSPQGTDGSYVRLSNGFLVLHATGRYWGRVFEVHGPAYHLYNRMYGSSSWLGFPISDVYRVTSGERIDFEGGYIFVDAYTREAQAYRYW
jgi:hypothetical protein